MCQRGNVSFFRISKGECKVSPLLWLWWHLSLLAEMTPVFYAESSHRPPAEVSLSHVRLQKEEKAASAGLAMESPIVYCDLNWSVSHWEHSDRQEVKPENKIPQLESPFDSALTKTKKKTASKSKIKLLRSHGENCIRPEVIKTG